ncbi:MAG: PqiC family protein [candidate division KSB1 bacterium]|nr:PqiC family protein [candidate division KSB1 bacterium]MDZ7333837.1 PqiC family protein [candidate division KSB1 bacterium]MDZ7356080.1 PqiC family protein [candidate division KSB1 bacterium]MDZ7400597.1 PqiC family protein [candidate division KSB1 bacterium]
MMPLNRPLRIFHLFGLLLFGAASFILQSCATKTIQPRYYILDYQPVLRDSSLMVPQPFPYKVQVQTMKIPRTFDRVSIVVRYSAHRLDYYRYNLWAIRPQIIISDLIADHIAKFNIFRKCQREFLEERPDFEIVGTIMAIEKFEHPQYTAAHLALKLYLRTFDGYENLLVHEFDRIEEMPVFQMELFAQKLSDILEEEVNNFIRKIIAYFNQSYPAPKDH